MTDRNCSYIYFCTFETTITHTYILLLSPQTININYRSHQCHNWLPVQCVSYLTLLLRKQAQYFSRYRLQNAGSRSGRLRHSLHQNNKRNMHVHKHDNHGIVVLSFEPLTHVTNAWGVSGQLQQTSTYFVTSELATHLLIGDCFVLQSLYFTMFLVVFWMPKNHRNCPQRVDLKCAVIICKIYYRRSYPAVFPHSLLFFLNRLETDAWCRKHLRLVVKLKKFRQVMKRRNSDV